MRVTRARKEKKDMKNRQTFGLASLGAVALLLMAGVATAAENRSIPDEYQPPLFATGTGHTEDGALAGTVFIRSGDIPDNAMMVGPSRELLDDPDAPQWPLLVEGFGVFYYENIQIPTFHQVRNQPGVTLPIWFVSGDDMLNAWADGYVTYKELKDAPSRFTGTVTDFFEVQTVGRLGWETVQHATGFLDDDPSVTFTIDSVIINSGWAHYSSKINFDRE